LRFIPGHEDERLLRLAEAFYMATKQGGSFFGRVGSLESGYDFDALVVREGDNLLDLSVEERLERFLYAKGGAAIEERYVDGALVPRPFAEKE
jgi:guanine deaminase